MCHNLGADYSKYPFRVAPDKDIYGDKYQWGYKDHIIKQKDDVYQTGPVPGWNIVEKTNTWDKGIDDPCPSGFRVPTQTEWENVFKYNNLYYGIGIEGNILISMVTYWSSNPGGVEKAYALEIRNPVRNEVKSEVKEIVKHDALPIRCIKKLPNDK